MDVALHYCSNSRSEILSHCYLEREEGDWGWGQLGNLAIELPWLSPRTQLYSTLSLNVKDLDLDCDFYLLQLFVGMGLMVKPTNEGSFVRVGCFRHLMVSESGVKTDTEEASQLYKRFARQMAELTDGERGVLDEKG
jgi:hypothetical protein